MLFNKWCIENGYERLLAEWNHEKNHAQGIYFDKQEYQTNAKIWWICENGHEWKTTISHRVAGTNCPYCSNQKVLSGYNDLKTLHPAIAAEWHPYKNGSLQPNSVSAGTRKKVWWLGKCDHEWLAAINCRTRENPTGCPYCSGRLVLQGFNDLETLFPHVAQSWNTNKNQNLKPTDVTSKSAKKAWWICPKGHEWEAPIYSRTNGCDCPICANKTIIKGYNDLQTTHPHLTKEWHFERNKTLTPNRISSGYSKKVWWKCQNGHEWETSPASRIYYNLGCPYCSGRYAIRGETDFTIEYPELLKEWDYDKNTLQPYEVKKGSHVKVWWKCIKGHSYHASVHSRTNMDSGCPICVKELHVSLPEKCIYYYIQQIFPNAIENYQSDWLERFELDIFIPELNTGIEYDGQRWHTDIAKDIKKNSLCMKKGVQLIRIREPKCPALNDNSEIRLKTLDLQELESIIPKILEKLEIFQVVDCNIERDWIKIYSTINRYIKENSLASTAPHILKEWDYERNEGIDPFTISKGSSKKFWFKCKNGHSWSTSVSNRTKTDNTGCPYCANQRILPGYNDLSSTHPHILQEWNYSKNSIKPDEVIAHTHTKAWWVCKECGNEWFAEIKSRIEGRGCPSCAKKQRALTKSIPKTEKSLLDKYPELCKEWDYINNKNIRPENVHPGSHRKVFWRCQKQNHSYEMQISNKVHGRNCPYCSGKKILSGFNDLASLYPELISEWDYKMNGELTPKHVTKGSNKIVWWKCSNCNHSYERRITEQVKSKNCPSCRHKV